MAQGGGECRWPDTNLELFQAVLEGDNVYALGVLDFGKLVHNHAIDAHAHLHGAHNGHKLLVHRERGESREKVMVT